MGGRLDRNQDEVIEGAMQADRRLTVFLKNGVPMRGKILAHDSYTIFMETDKAQALIYKHSVTSLRPARLKGPGGGAPSGGHGGHGGHGGRSGGPPRGSSHGHSSGAGGGGRGPGRGPKPPKPKRD